MIKHEDTSTLSGVGSSDGLERCPFCGSTAKFGKVPEWDYRDDTVMQNAGGEFIECSNIACAATTMLIFPTMADAKPLLVEKWNRRSNEKLRGEVEKLTDKVAKYERVTNAINEVLSDGAYKYEP